MTLVGAAIRVYKHRGLRCRHGLRARLLTINGLAVEACGFGAPTTRVGELVFTTAMTGYTESLTDPSYMGQILVASHPMVGNYGVPARTIGWHGLPVNYESPQITVEGLIVSTLTDAYPYAAVSSLHTWLAGEGVPGAYRVDTRFLIKSIRETGVSMAILHVYPEHGEPLEWSELASRLEKAPSYDTIPYAYKASPTRPLTHYPEAPPRAHVSLLDCGVKLGIVRRLLEKRIAVTRYPCNAKPDELIEGYDGIVVGSGPGNPGLLREAMEAAAEAVASGKPVLGICLGMQLIALGLGASHYKMRYGHRAVNKPVVEEGGGACYITTHNHGYAIDHSTLGEAGLKPWFWQPDDGTLEGFTSRDGLVLAIQFHAEAGPGPWDTLWVFDRFAGLLAAGRRGL